MNVLIVDDDVFLARALSRALGHAGHTCRTASSVEAAVAQVAVHLPSLVITDLDLGGAADGIDLVRWLRRSGLPIPIVMMTGGGVNLARVELTRAGLDEIDVVAKPCPLWRLLSVLDERCPPGATPPASGVAAPVKGGWS